jgi:hypothetical protein
MMGLQQDDDEKSVNPDGTVKLPRKKDLLKTLHTDHFKGKLKPIAAELGKVLLDAFGLPRKEVVTTQLTDEDLKVIANFFNVFYTSKGFKDGGFPGASAFVIAEFKKSPFKDILGRLAGFPAMVKAETPTLMGDHLEFPLLDVRNMDDEELIRVLMSMYLVCAHTLDENIVGGFAELNALSPSFAGKALALLKEHFKETPDVMAELNKVLFGSLDKHLGDIAKLIDTVKSAQEWLKMFNEKKGSLSETQKEALAKSFLAKAAPLISAGYDDELKIWKNKNPDDTSGVSAGFKEIQALEKVCRSGDVYALVKKAAQDDFDKGLGVAKRALFEFQRDFFIAQFEKALGKGDFTIAQDLLPVIKKYVDKYMTGDAYKKLEEQLGLAKKSGGGDLQDWLKRFSGSLFQLANDLKQ